MENYNYVLGLDLGTGSIGWSCVLYDDMGQPFRILDLGSSIFDPEGSSMEDRRLARGLRRVLRRRKGRVNKTKELFKINKFLTHQEVTNIFSSTSVVKKSPYEIKVKGKKEKLTYEELCTVLVHYSKSRGFKSNRKALEVGKETKAATEEQKLLFAKQRTENTLKQKQAEDSSYTITNLLLENMSSGGRIRNTSGEYSVGITRQMIEEEVCYILDKQISFGLITEDFKSAYLDILLHQRLFSEGPDEPSPYHNPLQQMIGLCKFTHESRAAKSSCSYELFTLIQKLRDLRYYDGENKERCKLTTADTEKLINLALEGKSINYGLVRKVIGKSNVRFVGLLLSKSKYIEIITKIKEKPTLDKNEEIAIAKDKTGIFELKKYNDLRKKVQKAFGKEFEVSQEQYDLIADCLTRCKSDDEMDTYLDGNRNVLKHVVITEEMKNFIKGLDDQGFTTFGKVSFKFLHEVLPLMIHEDMDYSQACASLGYNHSKQITNKEDFEQLPIIEKILDELDQSVNNKSVVRTLVESRKLVNAILSKYGKPMAIHVEMARELTKSAEERNKIQNKNMDNQSLNMGLKYQIYSQHSSKFRSIHDINSQDLIQYKLYIEQGGICPYTLLRTGDEGLSKINENELFTSTIEIDHIIPYSICFDDRIVNKVLVKQQENQNKSNKTPIQYCDFIGGKGKSKYTSWVKRNLEIGEEKQDRLLADKITEQLLNDYRARTLNDTRYAAKAFKQILEYSFPSIKIRSFTGQITAKLRGVYRLNGLTHSFESIDYKKKEKKIEGLDDLYQELSKLIEDSASKKSKEVYTLERKIAALINNDKKKNRDNHLHHALDATLVAVANDKVRRKIEMHEMALRQRSSKDIVFKMPIIDEDTGELLRFEEKLMTLEEYKQELENNGNIEKALFPQPYKGFRDECIYRTYELDKDHLHLQLSGLPNYDERVIKGIEPIGISHRNTSKVSGRMHKATFYGLKEVNEEKILTSRIAINTESFDKKKVEKLYDIEGTQSYIYAAVKEWLGDYPNGLKAFEGRGYLPVNRNGNLIKKVKLNVGKLKEEIQIQKGIKQYVEKEDVVQVRIYQRDNDDKLYFAGFDRFRLMNENKRNDLNIMLWTGLRSNNIVIRANELANNGFTKKPLCINKGQPIFIEKKDDTKGIALVVGFSSGMFEVKSIIGDGFDLIHSDIFGKIMERFQITVSTIKTIKPISIDILGKLKSKL